MTEVQGAVCTVEQAVDAVRSFAGQRDVVHACWDRARFDLQPGIPAEIRSEGFTFDRRGEVRWTTTVDGVAVLALFDRPCEVDGLDPLTGHWTSDETCVQLVNLHAKHIAPRFASYPGGGVGGWLEARIVKESGCPMFVSPRRLVDARPGVD